MNRLHNNYTARVIAHALLILTALFAARAARAAPLEVYGRLPSLEEVALSPDGSRIAFIRTTANDRLLAVLSVPDYKPVGKLWRVGKVKLRSVEWADNDHLMLIQSSTGIPLELLGARQEWFMLSVLDLGSQKIRTYPGFRNDDKYTGPRIMNVISGRVMVRRIDGDTTLFIPGIYLNHLTEPALFRVNLRTGAQTLMREGGDSTRVWLVDSAGEVVAQENYDQQQQSWRMFGRRDGHLQELASGHEPIDIPNLLGFGPDPSSLLIQTIEDGNPV